MGIDIIYKFLSNFPNNLTYPSSDELHFLLNLINSFCDHSNSMYQGTLFFFKYYSVITYKKNLLKLS